MYPLVMIKLESSSGNFIVTIRLLSGVSIFDILAVQSTCPESKWPQISSPNLAALSKLTLSPFSKAARVVQRSVSIMTSVTA